MLFQTGSGAVRPRQTKRHILYQGCECVVHAIFTICVLFLVCYSILNASCKKLFAQLRYDLIDHLAVSLALQLWHNSLHDLSFVSRSDQVCMFLCKVSLDLRSVHQLWSVFILPDIHLSDPVWIPDRCRSALSQISALSG